MILDDPLSLDVPVHIRTERLELRVPREGDGVALYESISQSLTELRQFSAYMSWAMGEQSVASSEAFCRSAAENYSMRREFVYLLFAEAGAVVGCVGLHKPMWSVPKCELGFWANSLFVGKGLIREAVSELLRMASKDMKMLRVELITDRFNSRAIKLARSLNFSREGTLRNERRTIGGELRDTEIFAKMLTPLGPSVDPAADRPQILSRSTDPT